jgi:uncharacterized protein YwgA
MKQRDLVLTIVGECADRPEFGRTSLQKVCYLVAATLGLDLGHRAYYYGPFSTAVEENTEALVLAGLLTENAESLGFLNPSGWPASRYHYGLTDQGRKRLGQLEEAYPEEIAKLREVIAKLVSIVGSLDQQVLSTASKTLYIAREKNRPLRPQEIGQLAREFHWSLDRAQVGRVSRALEQLGLVQVTGAG